MSKIKINPRTLGSYIVPYDVRDGVCIDVGANVGNFFYQNDVFRLVHAYEPLLVCFNRCLRKAVGKHHIHVFQQAITGDGRIVELLKHRSGFAGSSSVRNAAEHKRGWNQSLGRASSVTLAESVRRTGVKEIDYLKMDVECSEFEILNEKDLSPFRYIGIELHWQLGKRRFEALVRHIEKTHTWVSVKPRWQANRHREVLAKRKR